MSDLLYVIGSPRKGSSESSAIADAYLTEFRRIHPNAVIDVLDLWQEGLPAFDADRAAAKMTVFSGNELVGVEASAWEAVTAIFERFNAADAYLFTVPMWNGGIPWMLKLYVDILTQPGMVFGFDPASGYVPLLHGKKATVIYTSGVYAPGVTEAFGTDFHATYFNDWLRFIGISIVEEIRFQPTVLTATPEEARQAAHQQARSLAAAASVGRKVA
jgi:FMN-dependent NADH-azoreductase